MDVYTNVILTLLTIATGILTVRSFFDNKKKDSDKKSKDSGVIEQKLNDIDKRTGEIQKDVKDLREKESSNAILIASVQESTKSAHKRIDRIERDRGVALRKDA